MGSKERFYGDIMAMNPEVTGSCNLVAIRFPDGKAVRFLVDCGLFQEKENDKLNEKLDVLVECVEKYRNEENILAMGLFLMYL